jgi:hypothetical protein
MVLNFDMVVKVSMVDGSRPPCKFTTLQQEYLDLGTIEGLPVFHAIIPRVKTPSHGPSIDCLYLSGNSLAKDLSNKIAVCPLAWWWHLFKLRGNTKHTTKSLMDCCDANSSAVAHMSTFNQSTGTVTTQFANTDHFLDRVENELRSNDDAISLDKAEGGTSQSLSTFEISETAKASLVLALDNADMDLAANLHASTKSQCTNFLTSTGNSTNQSVNTKQYALTHKSRAIALALEVKKTAEMEHKNRALSSQHQELEAMLSRGVPLGKKIPPPASALPSHAGILFQDERAVSARLEAILHPNLSILKMQGPPHKEHKRSPGHPIGVEGSAA